MMSAGRRGLVPPVEASVYELPLREWRDVEGSKVRWWDFFKAMKDLARIRRKYFGSAFLPVKRERADAEGQEPRHEGTDG